MKKFLFPIIFALAGFAMSAERDVSMKNRTVTARLGADPEVLASARQKADILRVVPHLSVNSEWKSSLTIRNDQDFAVTLIIDFYNTYGNPVDTTFLDSDEQTYETTTYELPLGAFEVYTLDFLQLDGGYRSIQAFVYSAEGADNYGLEANYSLYDASNNKHSSVGVSVQDPGYIFIINVDRRSDLYSGDEKYRGIAITNTFGGNCDCQVTAYDNQGFATLPSGRLDLRISSRAKYLDFIDSLFPNIDVLLPSRTGYLYFDCTQPVSVLGLGFEGSPALTTSVPVDFFTVVNGKRQKRAERVR